MGPFTSAIEKDLANLGAAGAFRASLYCLRSGITAEPEMTTSASARGPEG